MRYINIKHLFIYLFIYLMYVSYSDKTWFFNQPECMLGPVYIIVFNIIHINFIYKLNFYYR